MADLAGLQAELKAAKERWEELKLGKAKKESETFPFPVWASLAVEQPTNARAFDMTEITAKLLIDGLEKGQLRVEIPMETIPDQLKEKMCAEILKAWTKHCGKKGAAWGIAATFEWVEANYVKLLMLDAECVHVYEYCDENDMTMKRYAIAPPAPPPGEEEDDESEEESDDYEEDEETLRRMAALLAEVEDSNSGRKKLTPEEIERKKQEAAEMGEKARQLTKEERAAMNKTRKEKAGHRLAKTGQAHRKFEGEGSTSKDEKKKKANANVKKRLGLS
mmetsp:Transcript_1610/g.3676  ORF Transcript_1610/g.3676 Transcript_1610/m.3676 type:complete len:277 (-) Transcript_1610:94-924(-)